jgi:Tfp pilus assembly protein PilF
LWAAQFEEASTTVLFQRLALLFTLMFCSQGFAFTGSEACSDCHAQEYSNWQGSHHDLAMQLPTQESVLGNFGNAVFEHNGISTRFSRKDDKFIVRTDGEDGKLQDFEVAYVFGVYPLQQYLLPLSRGRLQALSIAWDARPDSEGGQRWYHLHPEEKIDHKDPLHWTGPYYNWNTRCAECHSTDVQKNYSADSKAFSTTFEEVNVGCEACHGPGEKHLALAQSKNLDTAPHSGFPTKLAQRGQWAFAEGKPIAARTEPLASKEQIDNCGRCHSRRGTLGDYHYGADLLDTHRLSLLQTPLYHPDGQILDEVYVYGSFVQSKMHQAGVVCSNCHEPHSLELRAPDNLVCAQCHAPAIYDTPTHHHHSAGSGGALCANCHMPETTYMGVDPRRDHSMRVPRPDLSVVMGLPNACNQCHTDKTATWALDATRDWGVQYRDTNSHPARAFHYLDQGDTRVVPRIASIATDSSAAPIWRATAMEALGQVGGRDALQTATMLLYDDDPLLRVSTVRSLSFLPEQQRYPLLKPLIEDEITSVRMAVAEALAQQPVDQLPSEEAKNLNALFQEYESIMTMHSDMPGTLMQLGLFRVYRGDGAGAESAYREALELNKLLIPAYLNLADLLRSQSRDDEARKLLKQALQHAPDNGPTLHTLGLLETRSGEKALALEYLGRAADLETSGTRHRFVYGIALHDLGNPREAIVQLQKLLRDAPYSEEVLLALANYNAELGNIEKARQYAKTLTQISPRNRSYQQMLMQLSQ